MVSDDVWLTDLLLRARGGDQAAAAAFVRDTQIQLWRMLGPLVDATRAAGGTVEDLAQETYERAFGALDRYRGDAPARTWLLAIGRRVAADHRRRSHRHMAAVAVGDPVPGDGVGPDPVETVLLRRSIAALETDRREAFVLTQMVGLTYEEAAQVCGCPIGTIRSRVARARADLVAQYRPEPHRPEPHRPEPHRPGSSPERHSPEHRRSGENQREDRSGTLRPHPGPSGRPDRPRQQGDDDDV